MAMPAEKRQKRPKGSSVPRIAPPMPARSDVDAFVGTATDCGIELMPWQRTAARYIEAENAQRKHLYREVAVIVARQNGKTTLLIPLIVKRLLAGERIMHTAQDRNLPREIFAAVADIMWAKHANLFPERNGRTTKPRYANGQEEIKLSNGGVYSLVAPTSSGGRGPSRDLVILDEVREAETWDFIQASKPTIKASKNPQYVYLSNAGSETSVVLNALRKRRDDDPKLAYLEWSAEPNLKPDDVAGWSAANPAMGHEPEQMGSVYDSLVDDYRTAMLEGTLAHFETENLCRWVASMREHLLEDGAWASCAGALARPLRPVLAVSMDPLGERASIALAWKAGDIVSLRLLYDVTGHPIDTDLLGTELRAVATKMGVKLVGYDPYTDAELVKYVAKAEPINGGRYANASAQFVNLVTAGKLRWQDCDAVTADLAFTAKKPTGENSFHAVRSDDDRPITASLAAIRAVWLASGPQPAVPRVM